MSSTFPATSVRDPSIRHPPHFAGGLTDPQTWRTTCHLLLDLPVGVITFSVLATALSTALGLAITVVLAIPWVWLTFLSSRLLARMERSRAASLLGVAVADPYRRAPEGTNWWGRLRHDAAQRPTWREILYHLLLLPVGCLTFTSAVLVWSLPTLLILLPLVVPRLPNHEAALYGLHLSEGSSTLMAGGLGVVLLLTAPVVIHWLGGLDAALVRGLLGAPRNEVLTARVQALETSRSALVEAVDAERRRIERDLHDGAQQRLVSVAMDIGMAREKLLAISDGSVSPEVRALLDSAHSDAKRAISELRDVARGVHPAILDDRGLDAALSSLAARCPIPVQLEIDVGERPGRAVEAAAYYVVGEALTNVAKHADATHVRVRLARTGTRLGIEVTDDGRGGAIIGAPGGLGGGLAGLRDRVAAVDGWLQVLSPVGGPTTVLVELPCAS